MAKRVVTDAIARAAYRAALAAQGGSQEQMIAMARLRRRRKWWWGGWCGRCASPLVLSTPATTKHARAHRLFLLGRRRARGCVPRSLFGACSWWWSSKRGGGAKQQQAPSGGGTRRTKQRARPRTRRAGSIFCEDFFKLLILCSSFSGAGAPRSL